jgi:hypothetical protein
MKNFEELDTIFSQIFCVSPKYPYNANMHDIGSALKREKKNPFTWNNMYCTKCTLALVRLICTGQKA